MTSGATAIRWLFLIIAFLLFVWFVTGKYNESKKEEKSTTTTSPPATRASAPAQGKILYRFSDDGCVTVEVQKGKFDFYPKGGRVRITPPPPGKPWISTPGTADERGEVPAGSFAMCKEDQSAWGIEVWN